MASIVSQLNKLTKTFVAGEPLDVIIDLSNVCRCDNESDQPDLNLLVEALNVWKRDFGPPQKVSIICVADNSLLRGKSALDSNDIAQIRLLQKDGRVVARDFADPHILNLAASHPESAILSSDRFREFRVSDHPWLQGTQRIYSCHMTDSGLTVSREIYWSSPATLSRAQEVNERYLLSEHQRHQLENSVWECLNPTCSVDPQSLLVPEPKRIHGTLRFTCPSCGDVVTESRDRKHVASVEAHVNGSPSQSVRFLIEEDTNVFVGREGGSKNLNLAHVLGLPDSSLSRHHALLTAKRIRGGARKWRKWDLRIKRLKEASLPITIEKFDSSANGHIQVRTLEPGQSFVMTIHHRARIGDAIVLRMTGRHLPQQTKPWYSFRTTSRSSNPTRFS